jgi:hypothetical protein
MSRTAGLLIVVLLVILLIAAFSDVVDALGGWDEATKAQYARILEENGRLHDYWVEHGDPQQPAQSVHKHAAH